MGNCNGKSESSTRAPPASSTRDADNIVEDDVADMKTDDNDNLVCNSITKSSKFMKYIRVVLML